MHSLTAWCADHAGQVPPVSALQTCEPERDQPHEHVLSEHAAAQQEQSPPHMQSLQYQQKSEHTRDQCTQTEPVEIRARTPAPAAAVFDLDAFLLELDIGCMHQKQTAPAGPSRPCDPRGKYTAPHLREFRPRPPADSNSLAHSDHQGREPPPGFSTNPRY